MPQENWWNYWYDPRTAIWLIFYEIKSPSCCYATAWGLSAFAWLKWMRFRFYTWESGKGEEKTHLPHPLGRIALRWRSSMRIHRSAWLENRIVVLHTVWLSCYSQPLFQYAKYWTFWRISIFLIIKLHPPSETDQSITTYDGNSMEKLQKYKL